MDATKTLLPLAFGALAMFALPAAGQTGADFYKGKTVTYIVATAAGGGYDAYGRLVADFMQKHLPGSTFVVRNMPGAGHLIGTNAIYNSKPDGLTIGTFNTGLIYNQLIGLKGARFDLTKMSWIGKVASDPRVIVVSKESGIESYEQLANLKEPIKFAAAGVGSASTIEATMLINTLKLPIQVITGVTGQSAAAVFQCPADIGLYYRTSSHGAKQSAIDGDTCFERFGTSYRGNPYLMDSTAAGIDSLRRPLKAQEVTANPSRLLMVADPVWYYATRAEGDPQGQLDASWHSTQDGGNMNALDGSVRFVVFARGSEDVTFLPRTGGDRESTRAGR